MTTGANDERVTAAQIFLEAFNNADLVGMKNVLSDDLEAHITNKDGIDEAVYGAGIYLDAVEAMRLDRVQYTVVPTQEPVLIDPDRVLVMVEVRATREGRALHNFAAHLMRVDNGLIRELHMVDAKPRESDEFWA